MGWNKHRSTLPRTSRTASTERNSGDGLLTAEAAAASLWLPPPPGFYGARLDGLNSTQYNKSLDCVVNFPRGLIFKSYYSLYMLLTGNSGRFCTTDIFLFLYIDYRTMQTKVAVQLIFLSKTFWFRILQCRKVFLVSHQLKVTTKGIVILTLLWGKYC
jgi:hypothetical protein